VTYGLLPYGGSSMGWHNPWVLSSLAAGATLLLGFLYIETKVPDPMFRLSFFRNRSFAAGTSATFLGSVARGGIMLVLVVWFQGIWLPLHGYSFAETPLWAGILMMPMIVGFLTAGPVSGWLSDRQGPRTLATIGMAIGSGTFFALALLPIDFPYWEMGALLFVQGVGMGMFAAPNAAAVMNSVPPENRGAASGMLATLQNAGQQVSMAIFFTIIIIGLSAGLTGSVGGALAAANVGSPDNGILTSVVASNPTGALFGAFLGDNPMGVLLAGASTAPGWVSLSPAVTQTLTAPHFFAEAISAAFKSALSEAFLFAGTITGAAAVISAFRGERFVYGQTPAGRKVPPPSTAPAPVTDPTAAAAPVGGARHRP
jgi:MFS family permease